MDEDKGTADDHAATPELPEDVAILFSWANLPEAKYRDFSAARREHRARQRAQAAEARLQTELDAAHSLEAAAQRELQAAEEQVAQVREAGEHAGAEQQAEQTLRLAQERAGAERREAQRHTESAEHQREIADRARTEMREARQRAEDQATRYAEASAQREAARRHADVSALPGEVTDPYHYTGHADPALFAPTPGVRTAQATRGSGQRTARLPPWTPPQELAWRNTSGMGRRGAGAPDLSTGTRADAASLEARSRAAADAHVLAAMREEAGGDPANEDAVNAPTDDPYYDHGSPTEDHADEARRGGSVVSPPRKADKQPGPNRPSRGGQESEGHTAPFRPAPGRSFVPGPGRMPQYRPSQGVPFRSSFLPKSARAQDNPPSHGWPQAAYGRGMREGRVWADRQPGRQAATFTAHTSSTRSREHEARLRAMRFVEASAGDEETRPAPVDFGPSPRRRSSDAEEQNQSAVKDGDALPQVPAPLSMHAPRVPPAVPTVPRPALAAACPVARVPDRRAPAVAASQQQSSAATTPPAAAADAPVVWRRASRAANATARPLRVAGTVPVARTVRQPRSEPAPRNTDTPQEPPAWLSSERPAFRRPAANTTMAPQDESFTPDFSAMHASLLTGDGDRFAASPIPEDSGEDAAPFRMRHQPVQDTEVAEPAETEERWRGAADLRTLEALGIPSDTLQQSRERVASRWFALSGLVSTEDRLRTSGRPTARSGATLPAPMLSVFSLSGGVGKTSIVATLGRALSAMGESVLVADTQPHGILAYYFGAREQKPDVARTFLPPPGSTDAPVVLVSYDSDGRGQDEDARTRVLDDLERRAQQSQRILLDVGANSAWLARALAGMHPWILVPIAPDMNSVLGTRALENQFADVVDAEGQPVRPYYVLNQYDASLPLHLDVREVLRNFLGDRLLPLMLHRTPAVAEALAEGMTIIDYAPGTTIAGDYARLAAWVQRLTEPPAGSALLPRRSDQ